MLNDNEQVHSVAPPQQPGEPLAIIGVGCHFPGGATSPEAFWDLLRTGTDATREVPTDRWDVRKFYDPNPNKSGKMNTYRGGYLEHIDLFDAHFFGISPREAMWLDPQQRLLLQVTWEALEDAGQVAEQLAGSNTGVFMGGFTLDYQLLQNYGVLSRYELQTHSATGMMMTMLANRISYVFGFHGPSMSVDTACSSSLVAVHLASQSIWNGECSLALAGGVNAMIVPTMTIAESKGGFLSPDGRCKAFDASANGYARGEGAGVVLIKPLVKAQADGDPIYAVIRGTAVTQDGHTNGITVPNQFAQETAMRLAYERAGVAPKDVQYIEAHGTGTSVGDPIEARAIGSVLSIDRPDRDRCIISSVKTNIGHLEAAAGVAGLIKTALSLQHRQIPPNIQFHNPNPNIPFDELQLHVPVTLETWPETTGPALAGVNSFGFGGTNAHVVLQEAPPIQKIETPKSEKERPYLLPLSARSSEALHAVAKKYTTFLANPELSASLYDIAYSSSLRHSHHDYRLALVAHSKEEAMTHLEAYLADTPLAGTSSGRTVLGERPKTVFVCSGMGPQWWAMGRDLLANEPLFRSSIERTDAELRQYTGWSLIDELTANEADSQMEETAYAQPANFAIQIALAELWRSWGIEPDAIIGHSTGEVAAHYLSGTLSFEEAVLVIYHRSRLQQKTSGQGRMLAVGLTSETLNQAVHDAGPGVSVAAINSPSAITLVGEVAVLENMASQLQTFQVFHRFLAGKVPYHSHFMDSLHDELLEVLAGLQPRTATLPLYSTVTGTRIDGNEANAEYWWRNVRATVLFADALTQLIKDGYSTFVELSPHPVLANSIKELLAQEDKTGIVVPSLRRREEDRAIILGSLGTLYTQGYPISWPTFYTQGGNFVRLPAYPWQLKRHWAESVETSDDRLSVPVHPLLGQRLSLAHATWESEISTHLLPYLADHRIQENVLLPGAAFIEMALAAAREVFGEGECMLEDLVFRKALFLSEASDPRLQTVVHPQQATVEIYSYTPTGDARWTLHASAKLRRQQSGAKNLQKELAVVRPTCTTTLSRETFYQQTQQMGFQYGSTFQSITEVQVGPNVSLGTLHVPTALEAELTSYGFHPALLDAAFQVLLVAKPDAASSIQNNPAPYLPVGVERLHVLRRPSQEMQVYARLLQADTQLIVGNIQLMDMQGNLLVEIEGFRAQSLETAMSLSPERLDRALYELEWQPKERSADNDDTDAARMPAEGGWIILNDLAGVGQALSQYLEQQEEHYVLVSPSNAPQLLHQGNHYAVNPNQPEQFQQLFSMLAEQGPFSRVVHLWSLDSAFTENTSISVLEQEQEVGALAIMHLIQTLAQSGWSQMPRLWLVTRGAQDVGETTGKLAIAQAPLWGLGRVIGHQEFSSMWGGLIDIDPFTTEEQIPLLFQELARPTEEDQIAFRAGQRYVMRMVRSTHLTPALPASFRPDGSYLITGGLGKLGLLVARWMVTQGARRLILMGRTPVPPRCDWYQMAADHPQKALVQTIQELEALGASIHLAALDVADEDQLAAFLADYEHQGWPSIRGVIHTAGVVQDELLLRMKKETFQRVLRPKLRGGWLLHKMLKEVPLDFFILFSSIGSVIASLGQGNYAAANAFLDALAHYRRSQGLPALSIGWGPWSVGMVEQLNLEQFYARRGIELITPEIGMQILGRVQGQAPAHLTVISANWMIARETSPLGTMPPMFALLGEQGEELTASESAEDTASLLMQLGETQAVDRQEFLETYLQELIARVLQLDPAQFSSQESLSSLGIDSMMAVEVKLRIDTSLKVNVSVLELLQGISIAQLATRLLALLHLNGAESAGSVALSLEEIQQLVTELDSNELERLLAELEQQTPENEAIV